MKTFKVHFTDYVRHRIEFTTTVQALDTIHAVRVARESISMPLYIISNYVEEIESINENVRG